MEEQEENISQISQYNDAGFSISRLNNHWIEAEWFANKGKLIRWKYKLDSIWRELYTDVLRMKKKKDGSFKKTIEKNKELLGKIAQAKKSYELYFTLNKRHEFLRGLQDLAGKAGVYVDEDEEDFE